MTYLTLVIGYPTATCTALWGSSTDVPPPNRVLAAIQCCRVRKKPCTVPLLVEGKQRGGRGRGRGRGQYLHGSRHVGRLQPALYLVVAVDEAVPSLIEAVAGPAPGDEVLRHLAEALPNDSGHGQHLRLLVETGKQ